MNILFSINSKYIFLAKSCIKSMLRFDESFNFYILHHDLTIDNQNDLINTFKNCSFHFIEVNEDEFKEFPISSRYPLEIYYRLFASLLLPIDLDRILYLDVDIIVINSLKELYNIDFEDNAYIACTHVGEGMMKVNSIRLGLDNDKPYINTGVLLMNIDYLRKNLNKTDILNYVNKYKSRLVLFDQDVLTALYGDKTKIVDYRKYNLSERMYGFYNLRYPKNKMTMDWVRKNTVIIHYCGRNKPWNSTYLGQFDCFYNEIKASWMNSLLFIQSNILIGVTSSISIIASYKISALWYIR